MTSRRVICEGFIKEVAFNWILVAGRRDLCLAGMGSEHAQENEKHNKSSYFKIKWTTVSRLTGWMGAAV